MKTFAFSLSSKRVALSSAAALGVATLVCPLQAHAQNASINAIQVSVDVAPISITGTRLGGFVDASGNGLTGGAPPTVDATGALSSGTTMTAGANTTFNYDVRARAGDAASASATTGAVPGVSFGSVTGRFSEATGAALTINGANAATAVAGNGEGTTATAIVSTTMRSAENESQVRRVATSGNQQTTFTAERQGAVFNFGGSGLTAVTGGGIVAATNLGDAPAIVVGAGGGAQAGVAFTMNQEVRTGEAAVALTASSTDVTQPEYGSFTNTLGGTTAGSIGVTNINTVTNAPGGAGTSSTLSVIQSLTAF
jgi:hypothetical protein